jgi:hypothetical protein
VTTQGPASTTVQAMLRPASSNMLVMPIFFPRMPFIRQEILSRLPQVVGNRDLRDTTNRQQAGFTNKYFHTWKAVAFTQFENLSKGIRSI